MTSSLGQLLGRRPPKPRENSALPAEKKSQALASAGGGPRPTAAAVGAGNGREPRGGQSQQGLFSPSSSSFLANSAPTPTRRRSAPTPAGAASGALGSSSCNSVALKAAQQQVARLAGVTAASSSSASAPADERAKAASSGRQCTNAQHQNSSSAVADGLLASSGTNIFKSDSFEMYTVPDRPLSAARGAAAADAEERCVSSRRQRCSGEEERLRAARAIQRCWRAADVACDPLQPAYGALPGDPYGGASDAYDAAAFSSTAGRWRPEESSPAAAWPIAMSQQQLPQQVQQQQQQESSYCPSRYEDPATGADGIAPPAALDRVAQMRSRIHAISERHGAAPALLVEAEDDLEEELQLQLRPVASSQHRLPRSASPRHSSREKSSASPSPAPPHDRLSSILSFLEEVEETSRADISLISSARSSSARSCSTSALVATPGLHLARAGMHYHGSSSSLTEDATAMQSRVALLEVEVLDKKKILETLKKALREVKDREKEALRESSREWEDKMMKQKAHYEASLERQLKLVDRLLSDKTELTKRCELFTEELKAVERKFEMKMQELEESSGKEMARQKQNWQSAEKLRREAWEKEKTREIKEITIKGLQPEVERILAERKKERHTLEEKHKEILDSQRRELSELGHMQVRETRELLLKEQEQLLEVERENHRRKLREDFEKFNAQMQEERSQCAAQVLAERRKWEQAVQREQEAFQSRLREAIDAERTSAQDKLRDIQVASSDSEDRHKMEASNIKEEARIEKERWQREQEERSRSEFHIREAQLKEEFTRDRDRQLDVLMDKLGRDHVEQQRALKDDCEQLVEKTRAASSTETRQLGIQLEEVRGKVTGLAAHKELAEQRAKELETQLDRELAAQPAKTAELEALVSQISRERDELREQSEKSLEEHRDEILHYSEMKERELDLAKGEVQNLTKSLTAQEARYDEKQKAGKHREDEVISGLEARVKRTVLKKDEAIEQLRQQLGASENKAREFEYLLARQREELLGQITSSILD